MRPCAAIPLCSVSLLRFGSSGNLERVREPRDELGLQFGEPAALALESVGPNIGAGLSRNQLSIDGDRLPGPPHAAFERVSHAEVAAKTPQVHPPAFVGCCGAAADDKAVGKAREVGGEIG